VCYYKDYREIVYAALVNKITNIIAILTAEKLLHLTTTNSNFPLLLQRTFGQTPNLIT
jgi:hypothetical protein